MGMKNSYDIRIKPRYTNRSGIPKARTPTDYFGNEIPEKPSNKPMDRTKLVKQKHEAKFKTNKRRK